jgi:hypothetical protein
MSEVRLNIRDARREISGQPHGSFAQSVIAALSAEPETIEELELALERFAAPPPEGHFRFFRPWLDERPHDAGVVVVEQAEKERLGVKHPAGGWGDPDGVWNSTFTAGPEAEATPFLRLFSVGACLCELTVALKDPPEQRPLIDRLSRDYGNLRDVVNSPDAASGSLIQPVLGRFCESLDAVAAARPDLADRCADLQERLGRFTAPPDETGEGDESLPF